MNTVLPRLVSSTARAAMPAAIGLLGLLALIGSGGGADPAPTPTVPSHGTTFISLRSGGANGAAYYAAIGATGDTFDAFKQRNGFIAPPPRNGTDPHVKAQYFNAGDLNLGRDMNCLPGAGGRLACYVSNYTALDANNRPIFSDDPSAAFQAMHSAPPFATVAMEYVPPTTIGPVTLEVRECDGKPTGTVSVGSCGLDARPPINVGEIRDPAPGIDVDTGIDLQPGDRLQISATGAVDTGFVFGGPGGPNGDANISDDAKYPLHPSFPFALIGRVGETGYFLVGQGLNTTHTGAAGRLFLRTNDDTPGNGWGHFDATVTVQRASNAKFYVYLADATIAPEAVLDSEGAKQVPGVCLACHGGKYDSANHTVTGASFLPFNTKSFKYDSRPGLDRASQEEAFRRLNALVRTTRDTSTGNFDAIVQFVDGMYSPSGVNAAGAVSRDDFVPPGWAARPNVYLSVVRPYCAGCHVALGPQANFDLTEVAHLTGNRKSTVESFLCSSRLMPHSEVSFTHFWTDDLGNWPNYVARSDTLGLAACAR